MNKTKNDHVFVVPCIRSHKRLHSRGEDKRNREFNIIQNMRSESTTKYMNEKSNSEWYGVMYQRSTEIDFFLAVSLLFVFISFTHIKPFLFRQFCRISRCTSKRSALNENLFIQVVVKLNITDRMPNIASSLSDSNNSRQTFFFAGWISTFDDCL